MRRPSFSTDADIRRAQASRDAGVGWLPDPHADPLACDVGVYPFVDSSAPVYPWLRPIRLVRRGSLAEVWQSRHLASGTVVAVKQLRRDVADHRSARQLLLNEAEVLERVRSPHVVRVLWNDAHSEVPALVLEWLDGQTLEQRLSDGERLACREALWIARQAVHGLRDLLAAGFHHGDVKADNLFLCSDGRAKWIDLGFARSAAGLSLDGGCLDRAVAGTLEYLAPEELLGRADSGGLAKDLYSLGVLLYKLFTGRLPFTDAEPVALLRAHQQTAPLPLRQLAPHIPSPLADLVHRLLSKQPLRRGGELDAVFRTLLTWEVDTLAADLRDAIPTHTLA